MLIIQSKIIKRNPKIQRVMVVVEGNLCRVTPPKRLISVEQSDLRDMADGRSYFFFSILDFLVVNATMYIAWITLHVIKVGSNQNSNMPSFSAYISSSIVSIFAATTTTKGGRVPTFIILYMMNQIYSASVIQCTIQIFHHYYKSEI